MAVMDSRSVKIAAALFGIICASCETQPFGEGIDGEAVHGEAPALAVGMEGGALFTCTGVGLTLTCATLTTGATQYRWNWGDGASATGGATAIHTYAASGTYAVTHRAEVDGARLSETISLTLTHVPPQPPGEHLFTCREVGLTLTCATLTTGASQYRWNWGDGAKGIGGATASHRYAAGGTYAVTHRAEVGGARLSETISFTVGNNPPPPGSNTDSPGTPIDNSPFSTYKTGLVFGLVDNGEPNVTPGPGGTIGVVCVGMSNSAQECDHYMSTLGSRVGINPLVWHANCAVEGNAIENWNNSNKDGLLWDACAARIGPQTGGIGSMQDVRVVYHKASTMFTAIRTPQGDIPQPPYPDPASDYWDLISELGTFAGRVAQKWPSVQAVYSTSRSTGIYSQRRTKGGTWSYESGHAMNSWLRDNPGVSGVWHGWGPYIWAADCSATITAAGGSVFPPATNGSGICYVRGDYAIDGVHPGPGALAKVSDAIYRRLIQHAWYRR